MTTAFAPSIDNAFSSREARIGAFVLILIVLLAIVLPWVLPDPAVQCLPCGSLPPSLHHPFGTDLLGRDVLSRVAGGARISLSVALISVILSVVLGGLIGTVAGYAGGWVDSLIMRGVDGALAIPRLFVLLLVLAMVRPIPLWLLILVLGTTGWFGVSRIVRGEALRVKHELYVQAAEALGARGHRIILRHLLPNTAGPLLVAATLGVGDVILLEAGLSFLGLGIQPPTPSWGGMIQDSRDYFFTRPWTSIFPGLAIVVTVLAVSLIGDAMRDRFDPRNA
ncbi:MAG TPA: ABC transporter permease [Gemmatimonadales bacterium]|jgi:peptide/nickel transport system permease protein|nr:ABC transporter permease [Gemmatimonadales bacterium]